MKQKHPTSHWSMLFSFRSTCIALKPMEHMDHSWRMFHSWCWLMSGWTWTLVGVQLMTSIKWILILLLGIKLVSNSWSPSLRMSVMLTMRISHLWNKPSMRVPHLLMQVWLLSGCQNLITTTTLWRWLLRTWMTVWSSLIWNTMPSYSLTQSMVYSLLMISSPTMTPIPILFMILLNG